MFSFSKEKRTGTGSGVQRKNKFENIREIKVRENKISYLNL